MHMETPVLCKPSPHVGMFVRAVVVGNDVNVLACGSLLVDEAEKRDPILICMAIPALAEYAAVQSVQGREQCGGSVPLVVMRHGCAPTFLHGQAGLRPIQRLDLALLVN